MPTDTPSTFAIGLRAWIIVVALFLGAVAVLAYYRTTPRVAGRLRGVLTALRMAAFLLLAAILMDPRFVRSVTREEPAHVVTLVDRSASMGLPESGWAAGSPTRFDAAQRIAADVSRRTERRGATVRTLYFSRGVTPVERDSLRADGQGTDVVGALQDVARRLEGENLTAVVLLSDGVDTEEELVRRAVPGIPVFAVGLGDTTAPEDVRIKDVDYNSVVRVPSRTTIKATVAYTGNQPRRVKLLLSEGERRVFEKDTLLTPDGPELVQEIPVRFTEPGRREFALSVEVDGHDAEPENNRRDIVIEGEKAKAKIIIADLHPEWEMHFLTDYLRRDQTFDFDVLAPPGRPATGGEHVMKDDDFVAGLPECDAVVLGAVTDEFLTDRVTDAIARFVRERGGGLLVLPGQGSLFEHARAWERLAAILPVRGSAPFRFNLQYTSVAPGTQAAGNPITADLLPLFSQTEWQERSPLLGYYGAVAPVATGDVLLAVRGRSLPALAYQSAGKGRVAVVSAGPLWRWKFLSEKNTVYDEVMSRLLDVLSRGEETDRFVLTAKKNVFDAGESPAIFAEIFNEKMQPVTGAPVRLEIVRVEDDGSETPLSQVAMARENTETTRFRSDLPALVPGRYTIRGQADLPDRAITSRPLEIRVSKTSVEFQRVHQDRDALVSIARRSGGAYVPLADVSALPERLPLPSRATQTVSEVTVRTSLVLFLVILALLSAEWLIRKRAGMI